MDEMHHFSHEVQGSSSSSQHPAASLDMTRESSRLERLTSPGGHTYDLSFYSSRQVFVDGPGSYETHNNNNPRPKGPEGEQINRKDISRLLTGETRKVKGWTNANGQPEYNPTNNRSEASTKRSKTIGTEGLREIAKKRHDTLGPDGRSKAVQKGHDTLGPDGRSKAVQKGNDTKGPDGRSKAAEKRIKTMGHEGLREVAKKRHDTLGSAGRSKASRESAQKRSTNKLNRIIESVGDMEMGDDGAQDQKMSMSDYTRSPGMGQLQGEYDVSQSVYGAPYKGQPQGFVQPEHQHYPEVPQNYEGAEGQQPVLAQPEQNVAHPQGQRDTMLNNTPYVWNATLGDYVMDDD